VKLRSAFVQTLGVQILQSALSISMGVMIARALGPTRQGTYAMLAAGVLLGALIGSLGQFQSNVLTAAGKPTGPRVVLARSILHSLGVGLLLLAGGLILSGWHLTRIDPGLVYLCVGAITAEVLAQLVRGINLGQHHVLAYNVSTLIQRVIQTGGIATLWILGAMSVARVMGIWILATSASIIFSMEWIRRRSPRDRLTSDNLLAGWAGSFGQGGRAFAAVAFVLLLIRCDIWMLQPMLGTTVVGQFSVATTLAEWLWYIPTIAGNLLFAVVAADAGKASASTVARVTRLTLSFSCVVAVALMLGGRTLVAILYGAQYAMAGKIFVALVPGMTAIAVHLVVDSYFAGLGFPLNSVWAAALSLVAKVALNFALVPHFGALGAAWATCIVYVALLGYKLLWFRSLTSLPWPSILLAGRADLADGLNEVRSWLRRRIESTSSPVPRRAA